MSDQHDDPELGFLFPETEEELMHFDIHNGAKGDLPQGDIDAIAARVLSRLGANPGLSVNLSCTYCKGGLPRGGSVYCAGCLAPHHPDCFHEYQGCSSCGEARFVLPKNLGAPRLSPRRSRLRPWAFLGGLAIGSLSVALAFTQWNFTGAEAPQPGELTPKTAIRAEAPPPKVAQPPQEKEPAGGEHDHDHEAKKQEGEADPFKSPGPNIEELFVRARASVKAKRFKEALSLFDRLIEIDPQMADYYVARAELYIRLGELVRALEDLERALRLNPKQSQTYSLGARLFTARGELERALSYTNRALKLDPARSEIYAQRAAIYQSMARHGESLADLNRAIELQPNSPVYYREMARSLFLLGQLARALECLDRAIAIEPSDPETYCLRAEVYLAMGQTESAKADLAWATRLSPNKARLREVAKAIERQAAEQAAAKKQK